MRLKLTIPFLLLLTLTTAAPIKPEAAAGAPPPQISCMTNNRRAPVGDLIRAEQMLFSRPEECFQWDQMTCQTHSRNGKARILVCRSPLFHMPCWALANIAKAIREACTTDSMVGGYWKLSPNSDGFVYVGT